MNGTGGGSMAPITEEEQLLFDEPDPLIGTVRPGYTQPVLQKSASSGSVGDVILVCGECWEFYEFDDEWTACPKCGEDLREVERA